MQSTRHCTRAPEILQLRVINYLLMRWSKYLEFKLFLMLLDKRIHLFVPIYIRYFLITMKKIYKYIYKTVIMFHDLPLTVPSWKFIWNKFHSFSKFHSCFNFVKRSWKKYYIPVRGKLSRIFARAENTFAREVGILQF